MFKKLRNDYYHAHQRAHHHTIVMTLGLVLCAVVFARQFSSSLMGDVETHANFMPARCTENVGSLDISEDECSALIAFYNTTNGDNWTDKTNRGISTTVCSTRTGVTCTDASVTSIALSNNNLSGTADFAGLINLQQLSLWNNKLTSISLVGLNSLQSISLNYNKLTSIDRSGSIALSSIDLYDNQLTILPESTLNITNITNLNLNSNCWDTGTMSSSLVALLDSKANSGWQTSVGLSCPLQLGILSDVYNGRAALSGTLFSKSADLTGVVSGDIINYTLHYENNSSTISHFGVMIKDFLPSTLNIISSTPNTQVYVDHDVVYGVSADDLCFQQFLQSTGAYYQLLENSIMGAFGATLYQASVGMLGYTGGAEGVGQYFYDGMCVSKGLTNLQDCFNDLDFQNTPQYSFPQLITAGETCGAVGPLLSEPYSYRYLGYVGTGESGDVLLSAQVNGTHTGGTIDNQAEYYLSKIMSMNGNGYTKLSVLSGARVTSTPIVPPPPTRCETNSGSLDISFVECEALSDLYASTNGDNWTDNSDWFNSTTICNIWYGISCSRDPETSAYHISDINIYSNNMSGILSDSLSNLTYLRYINLSNNNLYGEIPDSLWSMPTLWGISLNTNNFDGYISTGFSAVTNLRTIYVNENPNLTIDIDALTTLRAPLQALSIGANTIVGDITNIGAFTSLQYLSLNNIVYSGDITSIRSFLPNLTSLINLNIKSLGLSGALPDIWSNFPNLTSLGLQFNNFVGPLPPSFASLTSLTSLEMSFNNFDGPIPEYFMTFPFNQGQNDHIDISTNCFETTGYSTGFMLYLDQNFAGWTSQFNCRANVEIQNSVGTGLAPGVCAPYTISYLNAGPQVANILKIGQVFDPQITLSGSTPSYITGIVGATYGTMDDPCYYDAAVNATGLYYTALENVLMSNYGAASLYGIAVNGLGFTGVQGTNEFSYTLDMACPWLFNTEDKVICLLMFGIDMSSLDPSCGTGGDEGYIWDLGNLPNEGSGTIDVNMCLSPDALGLLSFTTKITTISTNENNNSGSQISNIVINNGTGDEGTGDVLTGDVLTGDVLTGDIAPVSETFDTYTGYTSTGGIIFTNDETIAVGDTGASNYLTFDTTGFAIEVVEGTRDGVLYAPTETEDPNTNELPPTVNTRTILLTIQAGASGASLESSGGTFTISFVVPGGTVGDIIPIYRSEDGITWTVNTPDPTCTLGAALVCSFETDHLSYFTVVRETAPSNNNSNVGGGGGGGMTTDAKAGICEARDCSDSYYDGVCGTCEASKHKAASTGETLLIDSTTGFNAEVNKVKYSMKGTFTNELVQAYVFAKDIGITTIDSIDKAMLNEPLIREHAAKMMVNYAVNVLGIQADGTRTECEYSDMANASVEMKSYARLACQLGIMGVESDAAKTPAKKFNGTGQVTRDQFGTMLSRTMYANDPVEVTSCRYCAHLNRLKTDGIMTKITTPSSKEVRGYVWLMMMRAYQNVISK